MIFTTTKVECNNILRFFFFEQTLMVNDQVAQLYLDLELEGLCTELTLTDSDDQHDIFNDHCKMQASTLSMIFEENTAFPVAH